MKDSKLEMLVTEACATDRQIADLQEMLKGMKAQLAAEAVTRTEDQVATEGGGWSATFEGVDGNICRVTMPGDALKPAIDGEGKAIEKVREAAGVHFQRLFQQAPKWKLVPNFREEAAALLGKASAKLIKLCTKGSSVSVSFETKEMVKLLLICLIPLTMAGCYTPSESERQTFMLREIAVSQLRQAAAMERIADVIENGMTNGGNHAR